MDFEVTTVKMMRSRIDSGFMCHKRLAKRKGFKIILLWDFYFDI